MGDRGRDAFGELNEFHTRPVGDDVLIDIADARVRNAPLNHHVSLAEGEAEIVERIELQRKRRLDLHAAMTHLADRRRLKNHYLAVQVSKQFDAFGIPLARGHSLGIIA